MSQAQRIGSITNYKKEEGRVTFEVVEPGKEKGMKVSAWLTVGEDWDKQTRTFKTQKPNPVVTAIENMRAAEMVGPWRVEGYEKYLDNTAKGGYAYRTFNATHITEALPGEQNVYTMDKDGNPVDENGSSAPSAAPLAPVGGSSDDAVLLAAAALLQGPVERLTEAHEENIKATYYFLKGLAEKWRGLDAKGWAPVPAPDMADAFS